MTQSHLLTCTAILGSALFLAACGGSDQSGTQAEASTSQDAGSETASDAVTTTAENTTETSQEASTTGRTEYEREGDQAKGPLDAPVVIVEYASTACPACGAFHQNVMPTVEQYVSNGDVRFVFREMLTGQIQLAAAGFMLARCAPEDEYFDVIDVLFDQQQALFSALQTGTAQDQLNIVANSVGFSDDEFRNCLRNEETLQAVQSAHTQASEDGIGGTPGFIINGEMIDGRSAPDGSGQVFFVGNSAIQDDNGYIPAAFTADNFERIILYFKNRESSEDSEG